VAENSKWFVIVNPKAGDGTGKRDWPVIQTLLQREGVVFDYAITQRKYHVVELTVSAINQGYKKILSVGGNGTLNEIVNGIFIQTEVPSTEILIGIIHVGMGKGLKPIKNKPDFYLNKVLALKEEKHFMHDIGMVQLFESRIHHTRYFFNSAGVGFTAELAHKLNMLQEYGRNGIAHYRFSMIKALSQYRASMIKLRIDDIELNGTFFNISLNVGICYIRRQPAIDDPNRNDGLLNVSITKRVRRWKAAWNLNKLLNEQTYDCRCSADYKGKRITISAKPHVNLEIDGEAVGSSPFAFTVLPKSVKVLIG